MARFIFLNPRASEFFHDWESIANDAVAILRAEAGRDPYDKRLSDLIGELSTRSDEFRVRWAAHNVKFHRTGAKTLHHPVVGDLDPRLRSARPPRRPGQRILIYSAEPASRSQQALDLLASWATTPAAARPRPTPTDRDKENPVATSAKEADRQRSSRMVHRRRLDRPHRPARRAVARSTSAPCTSPPVPAPRGIPTTAARRSTSPKAAASSSHAARRSSSSGPATSTSRRTVNSTGTAPATSTS